MSAALRFVTKVHLQALLLWRLAVLISVVSVSSWRWKSRNSSNLPQLNRKELKLKARTFDLRQTEWYLARWAGKIEGQPAVSHEKNFPERQIPNPLLAKLFRSRWLDIGLVLRVYESRLRPISKTRRKILTNIQPSWPHASSITHI